MSKSSSDAGRLSFASHAPALRPSLLPRRFMSRLQIQHSSSVTPLRFKTSLFSALIQNPSLFKPRRKSTFPPSLCSMPPKRTILDALMPSSNRAAHRKSSSSHSPPLVDPAPKRPKTTQAGQPLAAVASGDTDQPQVNEGNGETRRESVAGVADAAAELVNKSAEFRLAHAAYWRKEDPVPFLFLARALDLISNESKRIVMTDIMCNVFRTVIATTPRDLAAVVYLAANRIAPPHEGLELGIGDAAIIRSLADAYGRNQEYVKAQLKELGDLGLVAKKSRSSQKMMFKPQPLTVAKVFNTFLAIAKEAGKDSQDKKRNHIKGLLVAATDCEPQYLIRLVQSKMRIGLAEQTVLAALGQAAAYSEELPPASHQTQPSTEVATQIMKQVYSVLPDYDKIVQSLLQFGIWKLSEICRFSLGVPVRPMLAKPTKGVSEILDKFQGMEFTCEYKYDGERAQIHYMEDGSVEIYSRNAEKNTGKYPDVVNSLSRSKKSSVTSFVLDCEVVAFDREKQKILPFQILSTRARKDVNLNDIKVEVCIFAFDILYLNGQPLLQEQLRVRREHLYNSFEESPGLFQFATALISNDLEEIQKFLESSMNSSCEGLIVKTLDMDATYEPSKRSNNWLKLKKDYMDSIGDSVDLVPIAAFHGRGKRTGVYGSFLLACYDEQNEEYQTICNIGTGFTEKVLEERSSGFQNNVIAGPKSYYRYGDTTNPDVWFEPVQVWEVKAADLSISPVHRAASGLVDPSKGISLRFPRLIRVRDDKNPDQATTSEQIAEMYRSQKINHIDNQEKSENV